MTLTTHQLNTLRHDLVMLATIEYDDVMAELLDHYASLTEQKMASGLPFDEASKWAWAELGSGRGLQKIQDDYVKNIQQQIGEQHISILKSYFGWPAAVTIALVAALIYMVAPFFPVLGMMALLCVFGMVPMILINYGFWKHMDKQSDSRKVIWMYLQKSGSLSWYLFYFIGIDSFGSADKAIWLFQLHSTVGVVLCLLALLYSISFIQLFKENFELKMPSILAR